MIDFSPAVRDNTTREEGDPQAEGAAVFVREFNGGPLRNLLSLGKVRTEADTLSLLHGLGLSEDEDSGRVVIGEMLNQNYESAGFGYDVFRLVELTTPIGEKHYKIDKLVRHIPPNHRAI